MGSRVAERGLTFSPCKTVIMIFKKRRKKNKEPIEIMRKNKIILSKERTQFLGMTLDSRLNWEKHINNLRANAKRPLNTIRVLAGKKWGGYPKTLKKFYSAICRTIMDCGCQLYSTAFAGRLKKVDIIHIEGIRIYTGAFRTSPVKTLHVEVNDPPRELRKNELGLRFL